MTMDATVRDSSRSAARTSSLVWLSSAACRSFTSMASAFSSVRVAWMVASGGGATPASAASSSARAAAS